MENVSVRNTILMPCHGSARRKCRDERARLMTGRGNEQGVFFRSAAHTIGRSEADCAMGPAQAEPKTFRAGYQHIRDINSRLTRWQIMAGRAGLLGNPPQAGLISIDLAIGSKQSACYALPPKGEH